MADESGIDLLQSLIFPMFAQVPWTQQAFAQQQQPQPQEQPQPRQYSQVNPFNWYEQPQQQAQPQREYETQTEYRTEQPQRPAGLLDTLMSVLNNPLAQGAIMGLTTGMMTPRWAGPGYAIGSGVMGGMRAYGGAQAEQARVQEAQSRAQLEQAKIQQTQQQMQRQEEYDKWVRDQITRSTSGAPTVGAGAQPSTTDTTAPTGAYQPRFNIGPQGASASFSPVPATERLAAQKAQNEQKFYEIAAQKKAEADAAGKPIDDHEAMVQANKETKGKYLPYLPAGIVTQITKAPGAEKEADTERDILAQGRGFKDFADARKRDPKAAADIETARKAQPGVIVAGARQQGILEERKGYTEWLRTKAPVDPRQISNYVTMNGMQPQADTRFTKTSDYNPENLAAKGYRFLPEDRMRPFQSGLQALTQLDRLDPLIDKLFKGVRPGEQLGNAMKLKGYQLIGDPDTRVWKALQLETMPTNALQSGMTPGRIGEQIIENIEKPMFPNETDSYESAKAKVANLRQRVQNNVHINYGLGIPAGLVSVPEGFTSEGRAEPQGQGGIQPAPGAPPPGSKVTKWSDLPGGR